MGKAPQRKTDPVPESQPSITAAYFRRLVDAAAKDELQAVAALGMWYLDGCRRRGRVILPRSPKRALPLLERAALGGDAYAANNLGYCFDVGLGVEQDVAKARTWYLRAFRHGSAQSASNIGILYRESGDTRGYLRWLRKGAEAGDPDAWLDLFDHAEARSWPQSRRRPIVRALKRLARDPQYSDEVRERLERDEG